MATMSMTGYPPDGSSHITIASGELAARDILTDLNSSLSLIQGASPLHSPTRALARRSAGSLRSRGSLTLLARATFVRYVVVKRTFMEFQSFLVVLHGIRGCACA
jgi:hypothetical protein